MKVYAIFDPLYETIISIHKTRESADQKADLLQKPRNEEYMKSWGTDKPCLAYELYSQEFEVED